MKTKLLILFILFGVLGYGQKKPIGRLEPIKESGTVSLTELTGNKNVEEEENGESTKIFVMDLSKPALKYFEKNATKWLSMKSREQLVLKVKNGNPLKYRYKIDTKELVFFGETPTIEKKDIKSDDSTGLNYFSFTKAIDSIQQLMNFSDLLTESVNTLEIDFNAFYMSMKEKKSLKIEDIDHKREELYRTSMQSNTTAEMLLKELDYFTAEKEYDETKNQIEATKEKAKKLSEEIKVKLYGIDFAIFTLPIDVQGKNIDGIEFRLKRFNKETNEEDTSFAPHPYNVWITGGLKIDVSAGVFFTSLFDDAFEKKDDPLISDNKIIVKKNLGDYDFAFGSSINVHSRWNSWLNLGGNLGVAFTTNQKFQMLSGINFILGRQERIIVSAGLAMGKVDRLVNSYQEGGSYNLGAEGTIPMISQFKFGHFFGVTYNLSKVKKISLEKGIE